MAQHIYFGEWTWHTPPNDDPYWGPPVISIPYGCFDLRSVVACSSPGLSTGDGLFIYPQLLVNPPASLTYLGERGAAVLTPRKVALKTRLGLGENIVADTVGDVVAELYLQHAESEWNLRWGRLRGNLTCRGEVWKTYRLREGETEFVYLLACLRANYQKMKSAVIAGRESPLFHRRYLQYLMERYHITNYEDITQDSAESPLPHGTTWTESWPTVSTTISSGQDQAWTEVNNDVDVNLIATLNRLNNVTTGSRCIARCETALAGDAHFCQATARFLTALVASDSLDVITRFAAGEDTSYTFRFQPADAVEYLRKRVVSVDSVLATVFIAADPDVNYVLRLTSKDNDTHTCTVAGSDDIVDHSNADITGNVRCGLRLRNGTAGRSTFTTVSAEDLPIDVSVFAALYHTPVRTPRLRARMIGY